MKINNVTFTRKFNTIVQDNTYDPSDDDSSAQEQEDIDDTNYNPFMSKAAN